MDKEGYGGDFRTKLNEIQMTDLVYVKRKKLQLM